MMDFYSSDTYLSDLKEIPPMQSSLDVSTDDFRVNRDHMLALVTQLRERQAVVQLGGGSIVLAGATSLPELVSAVSGSVMGEPDLAIGTVLGSNMFNMTIFSVVVILATRTLHQNTSGVAAGLVAIVMAGIALLFIIINTPTVGSIGIGSLLILATYIVASYALFRFERMRVNAEKRKGLIDIPKGICRETNTMPLQNAILWLLTTTIVVLIASVFIAEAAIGIANSLGVNGGVVGVIGLAFATSLPEIVTSIAALRRGATGLLIGNVFGSNIFNMAVIFAADVSLDNNAVLQAANNNQAITAGFGIALMAMALALIGKRTSQKTARGIGVLILISYLIGIVTIVSLGIESS